MTRTAREEAEGKIGDIERKVRLEEEKLAQAKKETSAFLDRAEALHEQGLKALSEIRAREGLETEKEAPSGDTQEFNPVSEKAQNALDKPQDISIDAIDRAVQAASEKEIGPDAPAEKQDGGMQVRVFDVDLDGRKGRPDDETDEISYTPKPQFKFDNLQFGPDYKDED